MRKLDRFNWTFKKILKGKGFKITREISENNVEVTSGMVSFTVDVGEARKEFRATKKTEKLEQLLLQMELDFTSKYRLVSFHNAQGCMRLMLSPSERVEEDWVSMDFISGLKKVIAFSTDNANVFPLSAGYLKKWGVPKEVLFSVADRNMCSILRKSGLHVSTISGKIKLIEFETENKCLCAALMTASDFRRTIAERLGPRFLIIAPSASSLVAIEDVTNNIIEAFGPVVLEEYSVSADKLTTEVFLFSPSGVITAGKFKVPEEVTGYAEQNPAKEVVYE